jgi:hypothetical protein
MTAAIFLKLNASNTCIPCARKDISSVLPTSVLGASTKKRGAVNNQREFFDEIVVPSLNITNVGDWYKVKNQDIIKLGGRSILRR